MQETKAHQTRPKLGLALAGGGFRASLFHLGVLRRMAELDVLRHVEVLSTVSGGSIIGALYILLLKQQIDQKAQLRQSDYEHLVLRLQAILVEGIQKNLRTRLLATPWRVLRVLLTGRSLGEEMSHQYEYHLYREVVTELQQAAGARSATTGPPFDEHDARKGRIPLRRLLYYPGGRIVTEGIEAYNSNSSTKLTALILNATSLNSGRPFRFSAVEVGDPKLGYARYDESREQLLPRKALLENLTTKALPKIVTQLQGKASTVTVAGQEYARDTVILACWLLQEQGRLNGRAMSLPETVFASVPECAALLETDFDLLRQAKLAAWYLSHGPQRAVPVRGGVTDDVLFDQFWSALSDIDEDMKTRLEAWATTHDGTYELLRGVTDLYYLRSAQVIRHEIMEDWNALTLGEAVGASACFPPVFPPFQVYGIYDDLHVTRLGLTDGGVYDNLGIFALLQERCSHIITSDTGGLFEIKQRVSSGRIGMGARIISILMESVGRRDQEGLRARRVVSEGLETLRGTASADVEELRSTYNLAGLVYFHINSPQLAGPGLELNLPKQVLAELRTDLDAFGDVEVDALVNHGYDIADRYIRKYLTGSPFEPTPWMPAQTPPAPTSSRTDRDRILQVGHERFFRSLLLLFTVSAWPGVISLGFVATLWLAAVLAGFHVHLSVQDVGAHLAGFLIGTGDTWWSGWTAHRVNIGIICLIAIPVIVVGFIGIPKLMEGVHREYPTVARQLYTAVRVLRTHAFNLTWPLGLLPFVVALTVSTVFLCSYVFFGVPFLWQTRVRKGCHLQRKR